MQTVTDPKVAKTDNGDSDKLPDVQPIPSHAEACEMLKKCFFWAKQQPETGYHRGWM